MTFKIKTIDENDVLHRGGDRKPRRNSSADLIDTAGQAPATRPEELT